jgi:hypothetical protein
VTASSQTPGPMPPESLPVTEGPACTVCTARAGSGDDALRPDPKGRRYPSGAQVLFCRRCFPALIPVTLQEAAAAEVIEAVRSANANATSADLAQAEHSAGILFDAASVEDAVSAAREQARAEYKAELAEVREQLTLMAGSRRQRDAVLRLCEGHRGDDLLLVAAVAVAAESGSTAADGLPMTLTWNRSAKVPDAHDAHKTVVVECTSVLGGRADLVVVGDDRLALASLLDAEVRHVHAPCKQAACGTTADLDGSDPALLGWTRIEVAGVEDEPRWYCSAYCVTSALARAGEELAIADDLAAIGGDL